MIKVQTYRAIPLLSPVDSEKLFRKMDTEWFRVAVNGMYNSNKERLHKAGVNTEIFHNHDEKTGKTKPGYPLISYHKFLCQFYLVCINNGVDTVNELLVDIIHPVKVDKNIYLKFEKTRSEEIEIMNTDISHHYSITDWLPLNSEKYQKFISLSLIEKIKELETILHTNIVSDFAKYLELDLSKTKVSIMNIDLFNRGCLQYKGHDYLPFSLEFEANVNFPENITLGNGKAFGFGRVNKHSSN